MSDLFIRNTDYNIDDIFNTSANSASLPEWLSVVDNDENHTMTGGNNDSIMDLLTDTNIDYENDNEMVNAINTLSAGNSVAYTMDSEQLEQKLADLFNKAEKNSQIRGGARNDDHDENNNENNDDYDSFRGGNMTEFDPDLKEDFDAIPTPESEEFYGGAKKKSKKTSKKSTEKKYKLKKSSKKAPKKASKKSSKKAPKKASKKQSRKSLKRGLNPAMKAFIELSNHVASAIGKGGRESKKIASKVGKDLLEKKPELAENKAKLYVDAIKYFDENKNLYIKSE
jgi:hypothetical protein